MAVYEASNPIDRNAPQWGVNEQLNTVLVDNSNNNSGSSSTSKHKNNSTEQVLWLDLSEEPALTRLCVAPKDIYYLPSEWEDRRLSNGNQSMRITVMVIWLSSYFLLLRVVHFGYS